MYALHGELNDDAWKIARMDVFKFVEKSPLKFDLIFADPPFQMKGYDKLPKAIFDSGILRPDGLLILALAQLVVGLGISLDGRCLHYSE